jgi:hypothetical protein
VWDALRPFALAPNGYYQPSRWVPHVTLALHEVEPERLGCAIADIAFRRIDLEIVVDHFSIIFQSGGVAGQKSRFGFGESIQPVGGFQ